LLILRVTVGGLLAGHGGQKLFGWFGGPGFEGTAGWLETLNLRPGRRWAVLAGGSEFLGGVLTLLGFINPLGPVFGIAAMLTATVKVHLGRPVWVTAGGAELPIVNMAVLSALAITGPGRISLDHLLGIRIPRWFGFATLGTLVGFVVYMGRTELEQDLLSRMEAAAEEPTPPAPVERPEERPAVEAQPAAATAAEAALPESAGVAAFGASGIDERTGTAESGESGADAGTSMGTSGDATKSGDDAR
jgi:putative oxidoreductase